MRSHHPGWLAFVVATLVVTLGCSSHGNTTPTPGGCSWASTTGGTTGCDILVACSNGASPEASCDSNGACVCVTDTGLGATFTTAGICGLTHAASAAAVVAHCPTSALEDGGLELDVPAIVDVSSGFDGFVQADTACADFSGTFSFSGACSALGATPVSVACITQSNCTASLVTSGGTLQGTIVGGTLSFQTTVKAMTVSCTATRSGAGVVTQCSVGGVAMCTATGVAVSFPGATRYCCDVSAQDCASGLRCNVIGDTTANINTLTACIPVGTLASGAVCTRTGGRVGADACDVGDFCAISDVASTGSRTCQSLCNTDADCNAGNVCVDLGATPRAGVCSPTCALGGTDCAGGTCRPLLGWATSPGTEAVSTYVNACQPHGTVGLHGACTTSLDCGASLICVQQSCATACDMNTACPSGQSCTTFTDANNPNQSGDCM